MWGNVFKWFYITGHNVPHSSHFVIVFCGIGLDSCVLSCYMSASIFFLPFNVCCLVKERLGSAGKELDFVFFHCRQTKIGWMLYRNTRPLDLFNCIMISDINLTVLKSMLHASQIRNDIYIKLCSPNWIIIVSFCCFKT